MVKKFTIPFASQGDANDIPDALQVDGKVSFTQGFGYDYERPYDDPQAKDIAREDMNGLFKAITSAVGELQTLGASEWSNAISYPKGAIVYHEKDLYISQVDDNQNEPPQNWVSITSIANDSLKKVANLSDLTDKATARNNLGLGSSATLNKTDVPGTSTNLVATQKLVNDTKINLESSKQDKLTFTGTGNVARMSEVDKKRDLSDYTFTDSHWPEIRLKATALTGEGANIHLINDNSTFKVVYRDKADQENLSVISFRKKTGNVALTSDIEDVAVDQIFIFESSTPPNGYIARNGQAIDRNTMPKLYARYGANLPDDRDRALRMAGSLAGTAGSTQEDAMQNAKGSINNLTHGPVVGATASGVFRHIDGTDLGNVRDSQGGGTNSFLFDLSLTNRTSTETRVKSRIVIFCNKIQ